MVKNSAVLFGESRIDGCGTLFRIEKADPYWAVILPAEGSMDQQPVVFEKLLAYLRSNGIETAGPPFTNQYTDDSVVQHYELRWDAGYQVMDTVTVKAPFRCVRSPRRDLVRIHYSKEMDEKVISVQLAAWLYHHDLRNRLPNRLFWTHGIYRPGREVQRLEIEFQVENEGTLSRDTVVHPVRHGMPGAPPSEDRELETVG
jgi:hypothetical protein